MVGEFLSHYKVLERIGSGAMGEVYLAEDLHLRRTVALKVLPRQLSRNEVARERLLREARAASQLSHPNIATIYEADEADGEIYLTMEYVEGEPLSKLIQRGPLSSQDVVRIGVQIADALDAAHRRGVIHRDVKPGNILIGPEGLLKVVDFGLAWQTPVIGEESASRAPTEGDRLTRTGFTAGTVTYMSPEQASGEEFDARSDLFALGIVLYEAVTGRLPFFGANPLAVAASIIHDTPDAPRELAPDVPPKLEQVILACLHKNPAERPESAAHVRDALMLLAEGRTTQTIRRALGGRPRRLRVHPPVVAVVFVALVALAFWVFWPNEPPPPIANPEAIRYFEQAQNYEARGYVLSSMQTASDLYRDALDLEPGNPFLKAHYARFMANYELLDPESAKRDEIRRLSDEAIAAAPDLGPAWAARARLRLLEGDHAGAAVAAQRAIDVAPGEHEGYVVLGEALIAMGRDDEGFARIDEGMEVGQGHIFARERKARVLYNQNRWDEAAAEYVKVLEYAPDSPSALTNLGAIYLNRGQYRDSIVQFKRLLSLRPDDIAASNLGTAYYHLGELDLAIRAYHDAIEIDPGHPTYKRNLGDAYEENGDPDRAREWWERALVDYGAAIEEAPETARATLRAERATTLSLLNRPDEAMRDVALSVKEDPENAMVLIYAASVYARAGDRDRVHEYVRKLIEMGIPRDTFRADAAFEPYLSDPEFIEILEASN